MQTRQNRGFTLIELMIVLAILAIVTVFAANSYRQYILEAHRTEGISELLQLADRLERFYSDVVPPTYAGATLDDGNNLDTDIYPELTENGYYKLKIDAQDAVSFTITATPQGTQTQDKCGIFTLDSLGAKSVDGSAGTDECWK